MSIDFAQVDWLYVAVLALFAFVANVVANLLSFKHRWFAAGLAATVFVAIFVFWTYYPHGLPLPTSITGQKLPVTTAVPTAPQRPRNPVTDITTPPNTSR
jgi:uncharacterized membrane protein AbrB (regulator of aidB expression)